MDNKGYFRDEDFLKKFGKHLQKIRKSKGISQEELANRCDFPMSQISRIERGIINTSISHVSAIAKALGVTPDELFKFH
ncbi:helix-turn-helix transcriptional regulator [Chitinophaga sp. CB10]|uniref:helix-turn-helix domain-containing protein n=1 Tax=Chitinophaga sp. CB10 TaxID=1891659 RepID=UPI0025BE1B60|nr:helix-turn-helix transcriptional regulator [Chitinophaga sp. CB10]